MNNALQRVGPVSADEVRAQLLQRGELLVPSDGFVGMRGNTALLFSLLERLAAEVCAELADQDWRVPAAISFQSLARADYFASFPQWLTGVSHLSDDPVDLARVAAHVDPGRVARDRMRSTAFALPPAVCYHAYEALADQVLDAPVLMTAQGTCWRNEEAGFEPLARGWAFTMREAVCVGSAQAVQDFRATASDALCELGARLELDAGLHPASDPFFSPTTEGRARGRSLIQRVRELKHELQVDLGDRRALAIGSVNHHASFFGEAFAIGLPDGGPAHSACLAFGLERWVLAVLMAHGLDPSGWPAALLSPTRRG